MDTTMTQSFKYYVIEKCKVCNGKGYIYPQGIKCRTCDTTGVVRLISSNVAKSTFS